MLGNHSRQAQKPHVQVKSVFGKKNSGQLETTIPWKKRYIKMKTVLLFFFLMSGILSISKRSDLVIEDKEIVGRFGRNGMDLANIRL